MRKSGKLRLTENPIAIEIFVIDILFTRQCVEGQRKESIAFFATIKTWSENEIVNAGLDESQGGGYLFPSAPPPTPARAQRTKPSTS